jgi:hypothetical protein
VNLHNSSLVLNHLLESLRNSTQVTKAIMKDVILVGRLPLKMTTTHDRGNAIDVNGVDHGVG